MIVEENLFFQVDESASMVDRQFSYDRCYIIYLYSISIYMCVADDPKIGNVLTPKVCS